MDETGITNVQRPWKLVATKGARHIGKVTSGERGATVTVVCAINAPATNVYFSMKEDGGNFDERAPSESVNYCSPNGWIDADVFVKWLKHLAASTNALVQKISKS